MAKIKRNAKLDSRNARAKLPARKNPYWLTISKGCAIGYYKGNNAGSWIAKWKDPQNKHHTKLIGASDDFLDADQNASVLDYSIAQELARNWFAEMQANYGRESYKVSQALEAYLIYLREECAETTAYDAQQRINNYLIPALGHIPIDEVTTDDIKQWRSSFLTSDNPEGQRKQKDTANKITSILKAALNKAFNDGKAKSDLEWRRVKPYKKVARPREVFLSETQCQRLINSCEGALCDFVQACLLTGARPGMEIYSILVKDYHPTLKMVHIRHGKTGARDVYLSGEGVKFFDRMVIGKHPDELVFIRDDGQPWGKSQMQRPFKQAVERAGLEKDTTLYALRHSYASLALLSGINLQLLAENMGTSIRMIEKHYGKFMQQDRQRMIDNALPDFGTDQSSNVVNIK